MPRRSVKSGTGQPLPPQLVDPSLRVPQHRGRLSDSGTLSGRGNVVNRSSLRAIVLPDPARLCLQAADRGEKAL